MLPCVAHHVGQGLGLPGIHQLLHIAQIQFPVPYGEGGLPEPLHLQPLLPAAITPVVLSRLVSARQVNNPSATGQMKPRCGQAGDRPAHQGRLSLGGDGPGVVGIHLDDPAGDMEVGSAASHYQDQGYPRFLPQVQRPFQERGNGLLLPGDYRLHQLVTDHEVGGGGVLIHQ